MNLLIVISKIIFSFKFETGQNRPVNRKKNNTVCRQYETFRKNRENMSFFDKI